MKNVKLVLATLVMVVSVMACSPNEEDIAPDQQNQKLEKFDVKRSEIGEKADPDADR